MLICTKPSLTGGFSSLNGLYETDGNKSHAHPGNNLSLIHIHLFLAYLSYMHTLLAEKKQFCWKFGLKRAINLYYSIMGGTKL